MATFLELCEQLAEESGGTGRAPVSVVDQTGRQKKIVNWIKGAWTRIQNLHPDWKFLRAEFDGALVVNSTTYSGSSFNLDRFAEWIGDYATHRPLTIYDTTLGREDETWLREISWEQWKRSYDTGTHDAARPVHYCIAPDDTLRFGPKPDKAYAVRGEYRMGPQALAANADIPDMPTRFHDAIVWRAIMLMSEHDEAPTAIQTATQEFYEILNQMQREMLPEVTTRARPIA